uniref:RNase H type-1 domain-containing protein n=1 Tax=Nelumbo nucifera TaxID=4432 RepID=A0A822YVG5_NELNU|nr:TPA_asm: hypothetical protein HUJ06_006743 [Nelumbo nucifera]
MMFDGNCRSISNLPLVAGIGGLILNREGNVIWAFSGPVGSIDAYEAEVRVLVTGLRIVKSLQLNSVFIEGDSRNVIGWTTRYPFG